MNNNGVRDPSDPPLPGVKFHVNDSLNGYSDVGDSSPSNWKGEAGLSVWLPGCPDAKFEVYADVPAGYRALSDAKQPADDKSSDQVFEFGFAQLPGIPTITPRPQTFSCTPYHLGWANHYDITDIDIAADGTVWVATYDDGLRKLSPGSSEWVYIKTEDGLASNQVRSIIPVADGSVWFGTEGGASRWSQQDGWTSYTSADGLINNSVYGIALSPDGDIWLATAGGVSHLDIQTSTWESVSYELVTAVAVSPDGTAWAAPFLDDQVRVVVPNSEGLQFGHGFDFSYADQLLFAPDGKLWIAGDGVGQYDPATGMLNIFDRESTQGAFVDAANALDIAPDGSIWIAATTYTPVVYHFLPWLDASTATAWEFYDQRDGLPTLPESATNNDTVQALAVTSSGNVWIATTEHATYCQVGH
jgi:ligand-binding sensor domain-containing protein